MCHDGVESTVLSVSDNDIEVFFLLLLLLLIAIDIIRAQPISSAVNVYTRSISIILWNPFYFRTFFYQWNEKYLQICWHVVILFHICHYMLFVDLWHTEFPIDTSKFEAHTNKTLFARRSVSSVFRMCIHITYAQGNLTSTSLIPIRCLQSNIWLWLKIEENAEFTSTYTHTLIHGIHKRRVLSAFIHLGNDVHSNEIDRNRSFFFLLFVSCMWDSYERVQYRWKVCIMFRQHV